MIISLEFKVNKEISSIVYENQLNNLIWGKNLLKSWSETNPRRAIAIEMDWRAMWLVINLYASIKLLPIAIKLYRM